MHLKVQLQKKKKKKKNIYIYIYIYTFILLYKLLFVTALFTFQAAVEYGLN